MSKTNREHFFGEDHIDDTIMLLTWDNHIRPECRLFKEELKNMSRMGKQLNDWLDSEKDNRFNW